MILTEVSFVDTYLTFFLLYFFFLYTLRFFSSVFFLFLFNLGEKSKGSVFNHYMVHINCMEKIPLLLLTIR